MKTYRQLREDWAGKSQPSWSSLSNDVFVNPSRKELKELKGAIRMIITPNKKVYIWDAMGALHKHVMIDIITGTNKGDSIGIVGHRHGGAIEMVLATDIMYNGKYRAKNWSYDMDAIRKEIGKNTYIKRNFPKWNIE